MVVEVAQYETLIQADETPFVFTPGKGFGVAFDLGTTTLVGQLVDLSNGHILSVETRLNPQRKYGNDLVSRLEQALSNGPGELRELIRSAIREMVARLCAGNTGKLARAVIVGNTVMQHLFCGSDIRPLSFYPFESPFLGPCHFSSAGLDWEVSCGEILFYPSIGGFVGSDILAGILATGMHTKDTCSVLIDLGTNGEIVAGNREQLLCASTAAGPAFEGSRISCGMLATTGAIASVYGITGRPSFRTIGDAPARGICGSGLIDAVAVMLREGVIGPFGEILSGGSGIAIASSVTLSQKDIYEFQLAKAAIAAGMEILQGRLGKSREEILDVWIAGAFGLYVNLSNALGTGMLDFPEKRIHQIGNTALMGARMFLFAGQGVSADILKVTTHVNLESDMRFQDLFVKHMGFNRGV
jgi:uncharacterized 2Fe-2S/4Fe-4S cluster protein (DUF4445 family)